MKTGFIQIVVPGFHLRGDFPEDKLDELVKVAIACIKSSTEFPKSSKTGKEAQPFTPLGCSGGCA